MLARYIECLYLWIDGTKYYLTTVNMCISLIILHDESKEAGYTIVFNFK